MQKLFRSVPSVNTSPYNLQPSLLIRKDHLLIQNRRKRYDHSDLGRTKNFAIWVRVLHFKSFGWTNNCQVDVLLKWSDQSCTLSAVLAIRGSVACFAPIKVSRLDLGRFKNLSDTERSAFNSGVEQEMLSKQCSKCEQKPCLVHFLWCSVSLSGTMWTQPQSHEIQRNWSCKSYQG